MYMKEEVQNKWKTILEHKDLPEITNPHKRWVIAQLLENSEKELGQYTDQSQFLTETVSRPTNSIGTSSSTPGAGAIDTFDPVLISLIRRAMPNLIAYDLCGVQPMTGPTGLIFAMRSRYSNQTGQEAFFYEANTAGSSWSGAGGNATSSAQGSGNTSGATLAANGLSGGSFGVANLAGTGASGTPGNSN